VKFLFVTYCMGRDYGQMQIGVYKRGLRVGMELSARGHEVLFFCTGRHNYQDALTVRAEKHFQFLDIPFQPARYEGAQANRTSYLDWMAKERPDMVVIGEAPMAGTLLESTLAAVESGIPVVLLDNAYHPRFVDLFCQKHGSMFDGIILSGPSALQGTTGFRYLTQVPPYIEASEIEAKSLLADLGLGDHPLMIFLAYDPKVAHLGLSLVNKLSDLELDGLFITADHAYMDEQLNTFPGALKENLRVIPPPGDEILFGLLKIAHCAVVKCGFMQVTESLTLHTPVIGFYFPGDFSIDTFPKSMRSFGFMTDNPEADAETIKAARSFLQLDKDKMKAVHDGELGAAAKTAIFMETMSPTPRADTTSEVVKLGFSKALIQTALEKFTDRSPVHINQIRSNFMRDFPTHHLYVLACDYSIDGERGFARLWGRLFWNRSALLVENRKAKSADSRRRVLELSRRERIMLEVYLGDEALPSIKELQKLREESD